LPKRKVIAPGTTKNMVLYPVASAPPAKGSSCRFTDRRNTAAMNVREKENNQLNLREDNMNYTQSIGRVMISQPMAGLTDQEIVTIRDQAICEIRKMGGTVINTLFSDEWKKNQNRIDDFVVSPLWFLAKSLEVMSTCHTVYFCKGWENARGCKIEHDAAVAYGLTIIYEE
jgi:hypothetical protein